MKAKKTKKKQISSQEKTTVKPQKLTNDFRCILINIYVMEKRQENFNQPKSLELNHHIFLNAKTEASAFLLIKQKMCFLSRNLAYYI